MDLLQEKDDKEDLAGCVGYCRVFVVDNDGLQRKTKGSRLEAPLHVRHNKQSGTRTFSAYFPAADPISMLKIQCDPLEYVYAKFWAGTICRPDENPNSNRLFCVLEGQNCKRVLEEVEASPDNTCRCQAYLPFIPDCYSNPVHATLTVAEEKFASKVVKVEVEVPEDMFTGWLQYFRTLRKLEKEEAADKAGGEKK